MIGKKTNKFDNTNQTVKEFNEIFDKTKLIGYNDNEIVEIKENITSTIRKVTINNVEIIHDFERRLASENDFIIDFCNDFSKLYDE